MNKMILAFDTWYHESYSIYLFANFSGKQNPNLFIIDNTIILIWKNKYEISIYSNTTIFMSGV